MTKRERERREIETKSEMKSVRVVTHIIYIDRNKGMKREKGAENKNNN
jgi:hypothetical protein